MRIITFRKSAMPGLALLETYKSNDWVYNR